jgi:1-pyrroline-5-carboxylate dehydrogenase
MEIPKSEALKAFAKTDPFTVSAASPTKLYNLVGGVWKETKNYTWVVDPMNGEKFMQMPNTSKEELMEFAKDMAAVPKSGLHNPLKNLSRYVLYGEISRKAAELMHHPDVEAHFAKLIQRTIPKHDIQARGEVRVVRAFLANFSGDSVRYLAEGTVYPGDRDGQQPTSYRWPLGGVVIISPFNFPLEIPALQIMGALYMGNKVLMKPNSKTTVVVEEFVRMLHYCGMPMTDLDLIHCQGALFEEIYSMCPIRMTQFTGSSDIAEKLALLTHGRVRLEDAGFDWKVIGPDVGPASIDYVAWQSEQDSYSLSGQKCSAESFLITHTNAVKAGLYEKMAAQASLRNLADLSIGPVLSVKNAEFEKHRDFCLKLEGAKLLFGGKPLTGHHIPPCYGAWEPSAYFVPLKHFFNPDLFKPLTTEVFGPVQVVTEFGDEDVEKVIQLLEMIPLHLTAGVVSSDILFKHRILANSVNGTTYAGIRGRTTGAPQNHWFGPAGDIRAAGIGTAEAIKLVWSVHREIIYDELPIESTWKAPKPT